METKESYKQELQRFAELFDSEEMLRDQVATVLAKFPGVSDVKITHGSQELGKDIVFFAQSGLDEQALHACVIKNSHITGSADSNKGARTVLNQAEQALDTAYTHTDGRQLIPAKVYVITPYECSQQALNSIAAKLSKHAGRIEFLTGVTLLKLFKKYRPDFFFLEGDIFGMYMAALKKAVEKDTEISNIAFHARFLSTATRSLTERYVPPNFHVLVRWFDFDYSLPLEIDLKSSFTKSGLSSFQHSMRLLIALLETSGFQQALTEIAKGDEIGATASTLKELLPELSREWESGVLGLKGTGVGRELRGEFVAVGITSQNIKERWRAIVEPIKGWIERFGAVVQELNAENGVAQEDPLKWVCDTARTKYYCVSDAAQLSTSSILSDRHKEIATLPPELLGLSQNSFLITGAAGFGKTSFCRFNTLCDIDKLLSSQNNRIPVYIPLHRLASQKVESLADIMGRGTESDGYGLDIRSITERPLRMYLDGLDEIPSQDQQRKIIEIIRDTAAQMPNLQVVVTGRDYVSGPWLNWLARVRIAEFTDPQIREFVSKWLAGEEPAIGEFFTQIENVPNLKALLCVPLLATLTLSVYTKTRQLPDSKDRLYDLFVNLLCGGWDDAKSVQRHGRYGPEVKKQILTILASSLHNAKKRNCSSKDIERAVSVNAPLLRDQWVDVLNDLLVDGLLISTGGSYAFAHLSFQEYLAARQLLATTLNGATQRLEWYLRGDDWWKEVLSFYVGLLQNPDDAEQWILRTEREVKAKKAESQDLRLRVEFLKERLLSTFSAYKLQNRIK